MREEDVAEFATSIAVLNDSGEIDDVTERVEMLQDAFNIVDRHIPDSKKKQEGTRLGSALISFGAGQKLIQRARLALGQANQTVSTLQPFFVMVGGLQGAAQPCLDASGLLACGEEVFATLLNKAAELTDYWRSKMEHVLPEFKEPIFEVLFASTCFH